MIKSFGEDGIDYEYLVHNALRSVVKSILTDIAINGLPGDHHFYICFATPHPLVQMPDYLHEDYPEDITIDVPDLFKPKGLYPIIRQYNRLDFSKLDLDIKKGL